MDELQTTQLVIRAQAGDREAFGQLAIEFDSLVFSVVLRRLRNRAEACEVTQDVFVQAMRKLPQLREPERFVGWLRQIAVRMSINRAVRRPNDVTCAPDTFAALQTEPVGPLDVLLGTERAAQVRSGLDRLGQVDRETLVAFYFDGQSLKEMSDQFDRPVGTIKRRLHTARHRLKEELQALQTA